MTPQSGYRKIRVVVAEDHARVRAGILLLLESAHDITVVGEAENGSQAIEQVRKLKPDLLLLDIEMPDKDGAQVVEELQRSAAPVRILILSAYDDQQYIASLFKRGVYGYLPKEEAPESLITAVRNVVKRDEL